MIIPKDRGIVVGIHCCFQADNMSKSEKSFLLFWLRQNSVKLLAPMWLFNSLHGHDMETHFCEQILMSWKISSHFFC